MEILKMLKKDHVEVKALIKTLLKTEDSALKTRRQLFEEIKTNLLAHARSEEEILYRALENEEDSREIALESEEEHEIVERVLQKMSSIEVNNDRFMALAHVLNELILKHVKEEESDFFAKAKKHFNKEDLNEMGMEFESMKESQIIEIKRDQKNIYSSDEVQMGLQ